MIKRKKNMDEAYLILADGAIFKGTRIGAKKDTIGEAVFQTGMVGYTESLTDPSYAGQILIQTFPLMGNYGVMEEDFEGKCVVRGYVVRELCKTPSNFRSDYPLDHFLKKHGVPGISGIDTRKLTRIIREEGCMNAIICSKMPDESVLQAVKNYRIRDVVKKVSRKDVQIFPAKGPRLFKVVLIDYGAKRNITRSLVERGCTVTEVPYNYPACEILAMDPDGIMLSNGPGDPEDNPEAVREISKLIGKKPIFGICLGHQLMALAMGGKIVKLKYGHHGGNQPVRETKGKHALITSQNHNYAVVSDSLQGKGMEMFYNLNDGSNEGMYYPDYDAFTLQFHPEACPGPKDAEYLFDRFLKMME